MHHPIEPKDLEPRIQQAAEYLRNAERVAVLTGAGVSAESGVPTFRGAGGLWEGQRVEDVATPFAFARDPSLVWRFYNARRAGLRDIRPNPGHRALVELEERLAPERFALITQNVDGLHRLAGSRNILELHGNLRWVRCTGCPLREDRGLEPLGDLPRCRDCGELLRPDIVWFHEMLPQETWREAESRASSSDAFLVVGTSAVVYPAAGLVPHARSRGAKVIEVNLTSTEVSRAVDVGLYGPSGEILPRLMQALRG